MNSVIGSTSDELAADFIRRAKQWLEVSWPAVINDMRCEARDADRARKRAKPIENRHADCRQARNEIIDRQFEASGPNAFRCLTEGVRIRFARFGTRDQRLLQCEFTLLGRNESQQGARTATAVQGSASPHREPGRVDIRMGRPHPLGTDGHAIVVNPKKRCSATGLGYVTQIGGSDLAQFAAGVDSRRDLENTSTQRVERAPLVMIDES